MKKKWENYLRIWGAGKKGRDLERKWGEEGKKRMLRPGTTTHTTSVPPVPPLCHLFYLCATCTTSLPPTPPLCHLYHLCATYITSLPTKTPLCHLYQLCTTFTTCATCATHTIPATSSLPIPLHSNPGSQIATLISTTLPCSEDSYHHSHGESNKKPREDKCMVSLTFLNSA